MKIGTPAAWALGELSESVVPSDVGILETDEEVAAARATVLDEEASKEFWARVKSATERRKTLARARAARLERELETRFGRFAGVATHPWTLRAVDWWSEATKAELVRSKPPVPLHATVVILFMAYRGKLPSLQLGLLACFLLGVHPVVVVAGVLIAKLGVLGPKLPKKYKKVTPTLPKTGLVLDRLSLPAEVAEQDEYDVSIEGNGPLLARLYAAALLARAGQKVLVTIDDHDSKQVILRPKHAPCVFPVPSFLGQLQSKYSLLLKPALIDDLAFAPVAALVALDNADATTVITPGIQAIVDALARVDLDRHVVVNALAQAKTVADDVLSVVVDRLPASALSSPIVNHNIKQPSVFATASKYTVPEALTKILEAITWSSDAASADPPDGAASPLATATMTENFDVEKLGRLGAYTAAGDPPRHFGDWCFAASHGLAGLHAPPTAAALVNALARTVVAYGGSVVSSSKHKPAEARTRVILTSKTPPPKRTLIAFRGDADALGLPLDVPVLFPEFSAVFSEASSVCRERENRPLVACICDHRWASYSSLHDDESALLDRIARAFPLTKDSYVFVTPSGGSSSSVKATAPPDDDGPEALDCDVLPGPAGAIAAGWLAAHKVLAYTDLDLLYLNRSLVDDLCSTPAPPLRPTAHSNTV